MLGIGVNVALRVDELPPELHDHRRHPRPGPRPTSSRRSSACSARWSARWRSTPPTLLEAYRARDALRGHEVAWSDGRGTAAGIDGAGRLVVELAGGGRTALSAGEVHLAR